MRPHASVKRKHIKHVKQKGREKWNPNGMVDLLQSLPLGTLYEEKKFLLLLETVSCISLLSADKNIPIHFLSLTFHIQSSNPVNFTDFQSQYCS